MSSKLDIGGGIIVFLKTVVSSLLLSTDTAIDKLFSFEASWAF